MFNKDKSSLWSNISSKNGFIFGLVIGILIAFVVGFFILLGIVLSDGESPNNNDQPAIINTNPPTGGTAPGLRGIGKSEAVRGAKNPKVTLVEFSDFQCPYCSSAHTTIAQLVADYGDDVAWVYRHFPLDSIHPMARQAAEASECANEQGKFWEFADSLFANQDDLKQGDAILYQVAAQIGLDTGDFTDCVDSGKYATKVNTDYQEGGANGVTGTPGTFVNGQLVKGALPYEQFKQIIDQALAQ
ncbi:MAG: DsbA family protein [Candidatus Komeilibacteria bacterium]